VVLGCNSESCLNFSCSLDCWKEHGKTKCDLISPPKNAEEEITVKNSKEYEYETEDTVPLDRLKLLGISNSVKDSSLQISSIDVPIGCGP